MADREAEWLTRTIEATYDCVLAPDGWHDVLCTIAENCGFQSGSIGFCHPRRLTHSLVVNHNVDDDWIALGDGYSEDVLNLWGGRSSFEAFAPEEPMVFSQARPPEEWRQFRYFREVLEPRGIGDAVGVTLTREAETIRFMILFRGRESGPVDTEELNAVGRLVPHIRRAVAIGNLLEQKTAGEATFHTLLDSFACAVVLVDERFRIVETNSKGEERLAAGDVIQTAQGVLGVGDRAVDERLRTVVRAALADERMFLQRKVGVPATTKDGAPVILYVLPLARGPLIAGLHPSAAAAIFVVDAGLDVPVDALAAAYGFTVAEARLFALLARGASLNVSAVELGVARSTAKTHLLSIFAKTGCGRQAELVALGAGFSLTV